MNDLFQLGAVPAILLASGLTYGLRLGWPAAGRSAPQIRSGQTFSRLPAGNDPAVTHGSRSFACRR